MNIFIHFDFITDLYQFIIHNLCYGILILGAIGWILIFILIGKSSSNSTSTPSSYSSSKSLDDSSDFRYNKYVEDDNKKQWAEQKERREKENEEYSDRVYQRKCEEYDRNYQQEVEKRNRNNN